MDQNPRHAQTQRFLAASLAHLGQREKAADVVREILKAEPHHTLTKLRARMQGIDEGIWSKLAEGLRLAGLPD